MFGKKFTDRLWIAGIMMLAAALAASCANLPQKPIPTDPDPILNNENETTAYQVSDLVIQRNPAESVVNREWTEPSGPTVTPIVIPVEKRGEDAAMIIRDVVESNPYQAADNNDFGQMNPVSQPVAGMKDEMELVRYSPFTGSVVLPGQALHLDIVLRNTGTTTWQTSYTVVDITEMPMAVQKVYNLPNAVAPGDSTIISVYLAAPSVLGSYPENFQIQDAYGVVFGRFDYALTVGSFSSVTGIPTLTPSVTPTYYSAEGITATPDSLAWMCIDPLRSMLQDCYQFCEEYSDREEFKFCYYNGQRYTTPVP